MTIPNSILSKMRGAVGGAGLALILTGCGQAQPVTPSNAAPVVPVVIAPSLVATTTPPPKADIPVIPDRVDVEVAPKKCDVPVLTEAQMKIYTESLGLLGGSDEAQVAAAMKKIERLGPSVAQLLANELNNSNYPPEIKQKIGQMINHLQVNRDPCPFCGMG